MPKKRLFNLKNLGSWAGITKKQKKNNGVAKVVDKENVCYHLHSQEFNMLMSAEGGQIPPGDLADIVQEAHPSGSPDSLREPLPDHIWFPLIRSVLQQGTDSILLMSDTWVDQVTGPTTCNGAETLEGEIWEDDEFQHIPCGSWMPIAWA